MNIRVIIFSFTLLSSSYLFARDTKDTIVMKNGDRLTCEIKGLNAGVLSVRLKYVQGTIGVQWSEVASPGEQSVVFLVQTESGTVYKVHCRLPEEAANGQSQSKSPLCLKK